MKRSAIVVAAIAFAANTASAFEPRTGHWWNPAESGRGFNIDIQENVLVITFYSYNANGAPQWYIASGQMSGGQRNFSGPLLKVMDGQCLTCAYAGQPKSDGTDGVINIAFSSETAAAITLPGGRTAQIQPFNFGYGEPPDGMLGEWLFTEEIGIGFADRFKFTRLVTGTANGAGGASMAFDPVKIAGCEYQVRGPSVGFVVCADINSAGVTENGYRFRFGLDQTFSGAYIAPTSGNAYTMKGWKTASKAEATKSGEVAYDATATDDPAFGLKALYDARAQQQKAHSVSEAPWAALSEAVLRASLMR
jgi:hypothetical protein